MNDKVERSSSLRKRFMEYRKATNGSLNGDLFTRFKEELAENEKELSVVKFCIPKPKKVTWNVCTKQEVNR